MVLKYHFNLLAVKWFLGSALCLFKDHFRQSQDIEPKLATCRFFDLGALPNDCAQTAPQGCTSQHPVAIADAWV
jgi:hypothetical protein